MAEMELTGTDVIQLVNQMGDQEKHFNGLETQYRLLASTWLLASLGAIGFLLKDDKSPWLDTNKLYLIGLIGIVGSLGIVLLWILDIKVYHKLLHSVFIRGILLELQYPWLPKIRTDMLLSVETGDITRNTGLYYVGSAVFLQLIALVSFISGTPGILNKIVTLLIGVLIITSVVIYMRKSNTSYRAKRLYEILKEHYTDDVDHLVTLPADLPPGTEGSILKKDPIEEKFATRISSLKKGFSNPPKLMTIEKSSPENPMQAAETNQWWYCLEGTGIMGVENHGARRDYFLQPNSIVPLIKGARFHIINSNQLPLEMAVFKQ